MTKQRRYDELYMDIALRFAAMSHAVRKKVGCVIVLDNNILSFGFNGMPAGMDNCCENEVDGKLVTKGEVSHAEENAIAKLAKSNTSSVGATAYVTLEPCMHCAKLLYNAGITRVVIKEPYLSHEGTIYLTKLHVDMVQITHDEYFKL
jgi:dCMP deaminase